MRYFVSASDAAVVAEYENRLEEHGYDVVDTYESGDDAVVLSVGGDGSVLYNSRRYEEPTILPVAGHGSEANTIQVEEDCLLDRLATVENGREGTDYRIESHRKLLATRDGDPIRGGFTALNDIHLHHANPVRAAKFAIRVLDGSKRPEMEAEVGTESAIAADTAVGGRTSVDTDVDDSRAEVVYEAEQVIGDGALVATPFGSSGYYRSITGGTIETGICVAFNNIHKPADAPRSIGLSAAGLVELELLTTARSASAVLARDDDPKPYEMSPGESISIALSDRTVDLVRFDD